MHQTTVRFGDDLWAALEQEASRLGVSVAQYVRDAALARLAYNAGFEDGRTNSGTTTFGDAMVSRRLATEADGSRR